MTDNIWTLTHASLSQRPRCIRISSITWNDESIGACLVSQRTSVSLTGRKQRRKGDGGEWVEDELKGVCGMGDAQQLTPGILGVQQSAAWPISRSSERSLCLAVFVCRQVCASRLVYWCVYAGMRGCACTVYTVVEVLHVTERKGTGVGGWEGGSQAVAGVSCGPQMRPLTDSSSLWLSLLQFILSPSPRLRAPFHFDGQYVLLPLNSRLLSN